MDDPSGFFKTFIITSYCLVPVSIILLLICYVFPPPFLSDQSTSAYLFFAILNTVTFSNFLIAIYLFFRFVDKYMIHLLVLFMSYLFLFSATLGAAFEILKIDLVWIVAFEVLSSIFLIIFRLYMMRKS